MANYEVGFWVVLAIFGTLVLLMLIAAIWQWATPVRAQEGLYRMMNYPLTFAGTTTVDILISVRYKALVPTWNDLAGTDEVLDTLFATASLDNMHWGDVAKLIADEVHRLYAPYGVAVELIVPDPSATNALNTNSVVYTRGIVARPLRWNADQE